MKKAIYLPFLLFMLACGSNTGDEVTGNDSTALATTRDSATDKSTPPIPKSCDCSDLCVSQAQTDHQVERTVFKTMTYPLGQPNSPNKPKKISFKCLDDAMKAIDQTKCSKYGLLCQDTTKNEKNSNDGIEAFTVFDETKRASATYPIALLKFIVSKQPAFVELYNAVKSDGTQTIVIRFSGNDSVERHFDLSGDFPPPGVYTKICE